MSKRSDEQKRLNPSIMSVALLDEIAKRLLSIEKRLNEEVTEGVVDPHEPFTVDHAGRTVTLVKPWFSVSIINDGPDAVEVLVNPEKSFEYHRILDHETVQVNMGRAKITALLFRCDLGESATIRMVGTR